ncbi:probable G-protein coupled receptor CG31760 [Harmonia axyridis]|uniref:probable G-protein coupled receptor CG31760 n=1 Tax=Harmonia axyridis TaxID=115357 RepID=UPI001E27934B|nr:probable G-protein coupled receptor CG31760 [Harmonia axyridis]XP_045475936.1 probable G-protein coupled receptor CG31760 [Harmonia axyridis]XP_045475937.1 probable G-protein coupled receptor CG31760 [Harmonia axyridis]
MGKLFCCKIILIVTFVILTGENAQGRKEKIEKSLQIIHDVAIRSLGLLCLGEDYKALSVNIRTVRFESARQKADLAATLLQDLGVAHHNGLQDAIAKNLLVSDRSILSARVLAINASSGYLVNSVWWQRQGVELEGPKKVNEILENGRRVHSVYPWYEDPDTTPSLRSPKFMLGPQNVSYKGWWTYPYYSCSSKRWLMSYSVPIPPGRRGLKGFLSLDIDISHLEVNQCEKTFSDRPNEISVFHGTHKCHNATSRCIYASHIAPNWSRGRYQCICRDGYYSPHHGGLFNGTLVEVAWQQKEENITDTWDLIFECKKCEPGCHTCIDQSPCLATYNWPFRITLLVFSVSCASCTMILNIFMFKHKRLKVFKVASPIFLSITLFGCATMYLEMAAIFPVLDTYSCIATKWSRHLGFCITYTALLMKTWRVSLTYRVKSAHKVKLTDKQLLQWMVPILLVMLIYLGTWTVSDTPTAEDILDNEGLRFKQCVYNWWDHSLAIGEVLFLAWGIRVCYNVRNAESLYNEARLISYAIYNIAIVNIMMIAFHLFIFPRAGPNIKYFLGFIRTQLSTSTTITLVFGPKVFRVLRGQGDQWDNKARSRGVSASFSLNGIGLVPEEAPDLYQENEELKEEIQKLAAQIEFMKIVHMQVNNRHLKPKAGGYFSSVNAPTVIHNPSAKTGGCLLAKAEDL